MKTKKEKTRDLLILSLFIDMKYGLITGKDTRKKLKLLVELEIPFSILKDILIDGYFPVIVERRGILIVDRFKPTPGLVFDFSFWRRMYKETLAY